jgi:iron complex outermembrane receptor protein
MVDSRLSTGRATALWLNLDPATGPSAPVASAGSDTLGGAVVARWTRALAGGASVQVQASFDGDRRDEPVAYYTRRSLNADAQYHTRLAGRHNVVAGFEFRSMHDAFDGRAGYALTPDRSDDALVSAFAQDEVTLVPRRLLATLGTKVEHEGGIGNGLEPTARLIWHVVPDHQHLWAAVSRALRTPSLDDRAIRLDFLPQPGPGGLPVIVRILGNPDIHTEAVVETEAGYRTDMGRTAALDVAVYRGRYDRLQTQEPLDPFVLFSPAPAIVQPVRFDTLLAARTWGTEIAGQWQPTASWRLNGSYALFRIDSRLNPASRDPLSATYQGDAPRHQWQVHGARVVGAHLRLDGMLFHVGSLADLGVPAYTRADGRVELMLNARWSIALVGQNLLDGRHAEFSGARDNLVATTVPRSVGLWLTVQR